MTVQFQIINVQSGTCRLVSLEKLKEQLDRIEALARDFGAESIAALRIVTVIKEDKEGEYR